MAAELPSYFKCFSKKSEQEKQEDEKKLSEYSDIISTLPKQQLSWGSSSGSHQYLYQYQGFWYHPKFHFGVIPFQHHFKAQQTDLLLASIPKSGTTWLKSLVFAISTRETHPPSSQNHPLLHQNPHDCIPNIENNLYNSSHHVLPNLDLLPSRILATHLPYTSLNESIVNSGCKIVYICRNPKDTFVSLWHFGKRFSNIDASHNNYIPIDVAFDQFCKGLCVCGPIWDHALSYWKASLEMPEKVLFLKYEDLVSDPTNDYLRKLAEFIGKPFSVEEEKQGLVQEISRLCSFENMSNLEVTKNKVMSAGVKNNWFYRKGKVGDWENYLTAEMAKRIDGIMEEKLDGSGLVLWKCEKKGVLSWLNKYVIHEPSNKF